MNITITGRHITLSENQKEYATKKIEKLEKYFDQIIDAHVIMFVEKIDHVSEVVINGDGVQFHGHERAKDLMSSIDLLFEKMERQIVKYKEKHQMHKGPDKRFIVSMEYESDQGSQLRLNQVSNKPIDKVEAYLQMKLNNNDFILFKQGITKVDSKIDYSNKNYAMIYKDNEKLKMIEIPFKKVKNEKINKDFFVEYELKVVDESLANPKIKFKKNSQCELNEYSIDDALKELKKNGSVYLPFFNVDSQYFNIIYKNGNLFELMVPAF